MIDSKLFRRVLGTYPTGVCVVTSVAGDGGPVGMSIGSFTSVSLDPALVAFFPDRRSSTWDKIRSSGRFCVNVLGDHQEGIACQFAMQSSDKFQGVSHSRSSLGLPILDGVVAWIDCRLRDVHEAGDHFIAVGEVALLEAKDGIQPLLFHRGKYGQLVPIAQAA